MDRYPPQPSLEIAPVAKQPSLQPTMSAVNPAKTTSNQEQNVMRLRGGCPGHFCGLPILPCACDICIIPIPCC